MKKYLVLVGMVLVAAGAHAATLDVNTTAALEGTYGLEVYFNGNSTLAYVMDDTPNNETTYRAVFKFTIDFSTFDFEYSFPAPTSDQRNKSYNMLFSVKDMDPDNAGGHRQHLALFLKKYNLGGGNYQWQLFARAYDPDHPQAGGDGMVYRDSYGGPMELNLPGGPNGYPCIIVVEYQEESAPGAADGIFSISRANNFDPNAFTTKTNNTMTTAYINASHPGHDVDQAFLGAPGGVDPGTTGSYYMDSFSSFRSLSTP